MRVYAVSFGVFFIGCYWWWWQSHTKFSMLQWISRYGTKLRKTFGIRKSNDQIASSIWELIGNTPMVRIESLSQATGCVILGKCEFLNPSGSSKDRVARQIILDAERNNHLTWPTKSHIYEATAGNTGISLTLLSHTRKYDCHIFMPEDQAAEKSAILVTLGAHVTRVPLTTNIADPQHFYNLARTHSISDSVDTDDTSDSQCTSKTRFFSDQFENLSNYRAHYETTGPEIWNQTQGHIDAIVLAAGTGGSLAGISKYLRERRPELRVYLIDPQGSGLHYRVQHGVCYAPQQEEGKRKRREIDSITEGIGINRITENFKIALNFLDGSFSCSDRETIAMSRYILHRDGLFLGSGSSTNLIGAVRVAQLLGPGHTIVTLLTDSGYRHLSKFWNESTVHQLRMSSSDWEDLSFLGVSSSS